VYYLDASLIAEADWQVRVTNNAVLVMARHRLGWAARRTLEQQTGILGINPPRGWR
jgi:hypothetical protein